MDRKTYRKYPEEFKLEALALLDKHEKSAGLLERELGITPGLADNSASTRSRGRERK